jgi:hypothetical protein
MHVGNLNRGDSPHERMLAYLNESDRTMNDAPEHGGDEGAEATTGWHERYGGLMAAAEAVLIVAEGAAKDAPTAFGGEAGGALGEHRGDWEPVGGLRGR